MLFGMYYVFRIKLFCFFFDFGVGGVGFVVIIRNIFFSIVKGFSLVIFSINW